MLENIVLPFPFYGTGGEAGIHDFCMEVVYAFLEKDKFTNDYMSR